MNKGIKSVYSQNGMALFQVLLITAVIAVLAIQFTQTAKNQISIANSLENHVQANVLIKTAESRLLFALLTEQRYPHHVENLGLVNSWNFYGKPFNVEENIEYTIQDQNALIGLFRPTSIELMTSGFAAIGVQKPQILAASIMDWQDLDSNTSLGGAEAGKYNGSSMPSNYSLQTYQEIEYINGMEEQSWDDIKRYVSIRPQNYINPKLAPKELLAIHLPSEHVNQVVELRNANQLSDRYFTDLSGLSSDEGVFFSASGLLRVTIKVMVDDVVFSRRMEFKVQPYDKHPFIEYEKTI